MKFIKILYRVIGITIIVFYWTIARHEGSHALMAFLEGADIEKLRLFPGIHDELGFYFAYVQHSGNTGWLTEAAPFFSDLILIIIATILLFNIKNLQYFNTVLLLGFISPIIDLIYNYQGGLWRAGTDVSDLLNILPKTIVHLIFITAIILSVSGYIFFIKRRQRLKKVAQN